MILPTCSARSPGGPNEPSKPNKPNEPSKDNDPMNTNIRPYVIFATCCLGLFLVTMDITIVNLGLPAIGHDLQASVSGLQWSIDSYTIVMASLFVVSGATADRFGRRRVFQIGLTIFSIGSLLCSLASTIEQLVAFRIIQAIGGSMLSPVALSIIANVFIDAKERAYVIGIWGSVVGMSMAIGPLLGGFLVETVGWRAIFWINVPVAAVAIALTRRFVPESRAKRPRRPDFVGLALLVVGLGTLTSCLIEGRTLGWQSLPIMGGVALMILSFLGLITYERRRIDPLIDLRFFRSMPFSIATILAVLAFMSFNGTLFLSSLYLQTTRGLSPVNAGLCLMPLAAMVIVFAPLSGRLVGKGHARLAFVMAGMAFSASALQLVELDVHTPIMQILPAFALTGIGFGLINAPITTSGVSGMPRAQAGVASAIVSTSRQVGATLGVALSGTIVGMDAVNPAFATATRPYWWLIMIAGIGMAILGIVATSARARHSIRAIQSLFDEDKR